MKQQEPLDLPQHDVPAAFQRLKPALPSLSAREVWYQAGLAAGRRRVVMWRAAAAVALAAAAALAVVRPSVNVPTDRIVYIPRPANSHDAVALQPQPTAGSSSSAAYVRLRDTLSQYGLSGLPSVSAGAGEGIPESDAQPDAAEVGNRFSPGGFYPMNERG
jgi:hypothetical protein